MRKVSYLRWSPAESPLRIEFPPALLGELGGAQNWGVLYGTRHGAELRLLAARRQADESDPRLGAMAVAGLYFCRPRGDVFLTESDLERFLQSTADVALVVCGKRAGFFLREPNGSVDSLRSYEEFAVPELVGPPAVKRVVPAANRAPKRDWEWGWAAIAAAIVIAIPVGAMTYLRPLLPQPIQLSVADSQGQLVVSWNPRAPLAGGTLEIGDGSRTVISSIRPGQHSATYTPQNAEVSVKLTTDPARMRYQSESAVRVLPGPAPATGSAEVRALEAELSGLQSEVTAGGKRASALEQAIGALMYRLRQK